MQGTAKALTGKLTLVTRLEELYRAIYNQEFTRLPASLERACESSNRGTDNGARKPDTAMPLFGDRRLAHETSGRRDDSLGTWSFCCK
jgi:hypothetical protein